MSFTVLRAMLLGLLRDRAALSMSFVLPAVVFLIFAAIFAGSTGKQLRLEIAVADSARTSDSQRLVDALCGEPALRCVTVGDATPDRVRDLVRRGTADVGLIVREGAQLDSLGGFGPAPLIVVADPARGVTVPMLAGQIQRLYFSKLPDVALTGVVEFLENEFLELDDDQREDVEIGLEDLRTDVLEATEAGRSSGFGFQEMLETENVAGRPETRNHVAYYAGGIAVLFLLFSSVHGAITLLEERESGILDRILSGPADIGVVVNGKFLFLVLQGVVQIGIIFIIAWLVYGVDLPGHLLGWGVTTLAASAAAAGLALIVASACRTRRQAQTLSSVAILVLSALGGSMVPRFLMSDLLQRIGWLTPNAWAIEAYTSVFWRDAPLSELLVPWSVLLIAAAASLAASRRLARRMEVL
jgi:ABC-2 type transport system permease protein